MGEEQKKTFKGQIEDINKKCFCERCKKKIGSINFYSYRDGSKCQICKSCLTAHIDNFNPDTFIWILQKMDVPYLAPEWNILRDRAFKKDPYKMNGMSVIGKYLGKMRLNQYSKYGYADSKKAMDEIGLKEQKKNQKSAEEQAAFEEQLKKGLEEGTITKAEYETLVSVETQNKQMPVIKRDAVTGQFIGGNQPGAPLFTSEPTSYEQALRQAGSGYSNPFSTNPYQEQNFISENELTDPAAQLEKEDKIYLALKWGRLYKPSQWIALEQLYNQFMNSFDVQGAARIDTLKMICKTSLKMNQAIDCGDVESYQKLSRVYDSMMKSGKFTEAQNKDGSSMGVDSASAIVDFVQAHSGAIPRYECKEPQDIVDQIIFDLKRYTKSLIQEDKSLAQEIEKFLQDKRISQQMRKDKKEAQQRGNDYVDISDGQLLEHKMNILNMKQKDQELLEGEDNIE